MDISATTAPRSDQQNFDDYASAPKTVTVSEVTAGTAEQPVEIHLVEFPGRPFKPSKTVRRILVAAWGSDASQYAGRRMTLYGDPSIKFGGAVVGGIRVSHLSHIAKPLTVSVTTTRGKRAPVTIQPLPDMQPVDIQPHLDAISQAATIDDLKAAWESASAVSKDPRILAATNAKKADLTAGAER